MKNRDENHFPDDNMSPQHQLHTAKFLFVIELYNFILLKLQLLFILIGSYT